MPRKSLRGEEARSAGYGETSTDSAKSVAERVSASKARHNDVGPLLEKYGAKVKKRVRAKCAKSLWDFIETYLCGEGGIFAYHPFPETRQIVDVMQLACEKTTPYHIRMTRGGGKTTLMIALILWRLLYGRNRYIVISAAVHGLAQTILDDIYAVLENCTDLVRDFPEVCVPIRALNGSSQKARVQHCRGARTMIAKDHRQFVLPTIKDSPSSGAMIVAVGFDGAVRGLRKGAMRPDLILLDDLQTDDMASSSERVEAARAKIAQSYLGLGSSVTRPAVLMTSTPIRANDLSEQYAESPDWVTQTFPLMWTLPVNLDLWKQWGEMRKADIAVGQYDCPSAARFYAENRPAMDRCETDALGRCGPLWPECYNKDVGEASAIEHAMRILYGLDGEMVFWSEYQMKPPRSASVYELDYRAVLANSNGLKPMTVPDGFERLDAAIDVMKNAGLRYSVMAFGSDSRACCVAYGRFPANDRPLWGKDTPDAEQSARLVAAIGSVVAMLRGASFVSADGRRRYSVGPIGIDSGWKTKPVHAFCGNSSGCVAMKGVSYKDFKPRSATGALRTGIVDANENYYVINGVYGHTHCFHADFWKETVQRAWLIPRGAANGLEVDGSAAENATFAMEQCGDRLVDKITERNGSTAWNWKLIGPNHFGDCSAMCLALAAWKHEFSVNPVYSKIISQPVGEKSNGETQPRLRTRPRPRITLI